MKFNEEQSKAINSRGKDLLVSASAGTGKTAVLIERVSSLILKDGANIEDFLIVTFTEAAAQELKSRIYERLHQAMEDGEGDFKHLSTQISLLQGADISTIHGFCKRLIEENFMLLSLEPDLQVADDVEVNSLKEDAFQRAMKAHKSEEKLHACLSAYMKASDESMTKDIVLKIYHEASSSQDPERFYRELYEKTKTDCEIQEEIRHFALSDLEELLALDAVYYGLAQRSLFPKYETLALKDMNSLEELCILLRGEKKMSAEDYEKFRMILQEFSFPRLPSMKKEESEKLKQSIEPFQKFREGLKKSFKDWQSNYFSYSYPKLREDMERAKELSLSAILLSEYFYREYRNLKRKKNLIDFDDMQHFALKILENESIGEAYRNRFKYIFVDEFQDTSDVQDSLIEKLKMPGGIFIVGDYKQSIYAFRKARPELFLKKYEEFKGAKFAETIELNENFRSVPRILSSVNDVFSRLMTKDYGGMAYAELAMLKSGRTISSPEELGKKTTLRVIDKKALAERMEETKKSKEELYYLSVIQRIKEITKESYIKLDQDGKRTEVNFTYADICLLSRSPNRKASWVKRLFEEHGVSLSIDIEENLFEIPELLLLIDFMKLASNPKDDMALLSVMRSPLASFTDDELFFLSKFPRRYYADFLEQAYLEKLSGEDGSKIPTHIAEKLKRLSSYLEEFRHAEERSLRYRLSDLIRKSKFLYTLLGRRGGYSSYQAIEDFLAYVDAFEKKGRYGLFQFLEHCKEVKEKGGILSYRSKSENDEGSVKLLSIHKSKGLQFKYVILLEIEKPFNRSNSDMLVMSEDYGLISKNIFREEALRYMGPQFYIEKRKHLHREQLEEMRLLYVAMTRAEERLELLAEISLDEYVKENFSLVSKPIRQGQSYLDWILQSLDFQGFPRNAFSEEGAKESVVNAPCSINENWEFLIDTISLPEVPERRGVGKNLSSAELLRAFVPIKYPEQRGIKRKTVSQLKVKEGKKRKIKVRSGVSGATERGNIYHKFMQFFVRSGMDPEGFLALNENTSYLSEHELSQVDLQRIEAFCGTELYRRIRGAERIWTEQPFVYKKEIEGQLYHLQGIVDLAFMEEGRLVIVDYKTDRLNEEAAFLERYAIQLELYAEALRELLSVEVKETLIYSFEMNRSFGYNRNKEG